MAKGLAAFAVGLGSGYLTAQQRGRDQERQDRQDAQNSELHSLRMDEANQAKSLRMGLADAVKPAMLNESAPTLAMADGTKTAYDSADTAGSDFRQLRRNDEATGQQTLARATLADGVNLQTAQPVKPALGGLASMSQTGGLEQRQAPTALELHKALPDPATGDSLPPGVGLANKKQDNSIALAPQGLPSVNGKSFGSLADARQAKTAYDSPEAQTERRAALYDAAGQNEKGSQIRVGRMQLEQMKQEYSDKNVARKIMGLQTPEDIAKFISDYPHDGQGGALKTEAVHSADGKSWGMVVVKPDGTRKPIPGEFSNDAEGLKQAHIELLSQLKPEMRVEMYKWGQELNRKVKVDATEATTKAAAFEETKRHNRAVEGNTAAGQQTSDARARDLNATKVEENRLKREVKDDAANLTKASQLASFDTMLGTLGRLGTHPGLARSVGATGKLPTMPGSDSANFQAELNTFQSQAFLPMVAQLKGMGALSDAEGKKLTAAVGALDRTMGEQAFRDSVGRITADMNSARQRMEGGGKTNQGGASGSWGATKSVNVGGAATEARLAPDGKYYVKQSNGKYAEVSN